MDDRNGDYYKEKHLRHSRNLGITKKNCQLEILYYADIPEIIGEIFLFILLPKNFSRICGLHKGSPSIILP